MAKIRPKSIFALFCLIAILGITGIYLFHNANSDKTLEDGYDSSQAETLFTYNIAAEVPPRISLLIKETLESQGFVESDSNTADISASYSFGKFNEQNSEFSLYQIWVITKPFDGTLAGDDSSIKHIDESIDTETEETATTQAGLIKTPSSTTTLQTLASVLPSQTVLPINRIDPLDSGTWSDLSYPWISQITISGSEKNLAKIKGDLEISEDLSSLGYSLDIPTADSFVTILKTGTSVTGGPGWELCERTRGITYPTLGVKEKINAADIAIISNETSFVDGCSQAAGTTSFCGKKSYMQNILDMGIDIISLTGNHMCDFGKSAFSETLSMYESDGLAYFGGGDSEDSAWEPLTVDTEAGTIAFIGYNRMGPAGVLADETLPGTAYYDEVSLRNAVTTALESADLVWIDTHLWPEYGTSPTEEQITLTQEAVDLGADIVTGVSSHEIQGMTFYKGNPILYGLGNFLFDQMWSDETRLGMAVEFILYDGAIRRITLLPTRMYDYCQPRFLEGDDKSNIIDYFISISDLEE